MNKNTHIKPMQWRKLADLLLSLKTGDTVEFACDPGCEWPDEVPEVENCSCWYFARVICIKEYQSRFILIDYAGGEEAFAIPLNNYCDHADDDDRMFVPSEVKRFFGQCMSLCGENDWVFVEMGDE